MFEHPKEVNLTHTTIDFGEKGGIYTKDQIEKTKEFVNHRDTKVSLDSVHYFDRTGGKMISHSEVQNEIGWSVLDWAQMLGGIDLKRIIDTIFSWIKGIAHTYTAGKFIFSILTICCFTSTMPGKSVLERLLKIFQYRSKGYMASQISKMSNSKGNISKTDLDLIKQRMDNLEKGSF